MLMKEYISKVYEKFYESDLFDANWTKIDEQISMLEWLDDHQLTIEAAALVKIQTKGKPTCNQVHTYAECFVPTIIEVVEYLVDQYEKTGDLPVKHKFILQYYLALSQVGFIVY